MRELEDALARLGSTMPNEPKPGSIDAWLLADWHLVIATLDNLRTQLAAALAEVDELRVRSSEKAAEVFSQRHRAEQAEAERERAVKALAFYADIKNYVSPESNCGNYYYASPADQDEGEIARAAIATGADTNATAAGREGKL